MTAGCPFITCAVKRKGLEFCWDCQESEDCKKWKNHREFSKTLDTFKCYQKLEDDIAFIMKNGVDEFEKEQKAREKILAEMLQEFNEGRSKNYYCLAATVLEVDELKDALDKARSDSKGLDVKKKSKVLHSILDNLAERKNYCLKLRK